MRPSSSFNGSRRNRIVYSIYPILEDPPCHAERSEASRPIEPDASLRSG